MEHGLAVSAASAAAVFCYLIFLLLPSVTYSHNITQILEKFPEFSTFNHYLTVTQLAPEINHRETITVCAVDNAGMSDLLAKHFTMGAIKNLLSLHVLLDYFDAKKLHGITESTTLAATMFQATGSATGSAGFVNIRDLKGGKVGFSPQGGDVAATFVKSVEGIPYNISVIQISNTMPSMDAEAPAPAPTEMNITTRMSAHGCKMFADILIGNPAEQTFEDNLQSGVTIFCPGDDAMKAFLPKFKNLTADGKQSLLEYHGIPVYQSFSGLQSNNGLTNTLATDGASNFDFTVQNDGTDVTIITKIGTAKIINTLINEQPVAIYELNKVLMPIELFRSLLPPAPAPAPDADNESPKPTRKHKSPPTPAENADSSPDAPVGNSADQTADSRNAATFAGPKIGAIALSFTLVFISLLQ